MIVYACTSCVLFMIMSPLRPKAGQFSQPLFFFFPQNSGRMGKMEYSLFAYPLAVHFSVGSCPFFTFVFQFVGLFVHVRSLVRSLTVLPLDYEVVWTQAAGWTETFKYNIKQSNIIKQHSKKINQFQPVPTGSNEVQQELASSSAGAAFRHWGDLCHWPRPSGSAELCREGETMWDTERMSWVMDESWTSHGRVMEIMEMESWYYMVHYVYLCVMNCAVVSWTLSLGKEMFSGRFNSTCGISMTQLFPLWLSMLGWNWEDRCGGWTFISYLVSLLRKKSNADSSLIFGANCPQFSMWGLLGWVSGMNGKASYS